MTDKLDYKTPADKKRSFWDKLFRPFNAYFYLKSTRIIVKASRYAGKPEFYDRYLDHCGQIIKCVESTGATVEYSGLENIPDEPCVYIGNHMSTLETITLGNIIGNRGRVCFIVKESLMKYPYFNKILKGLECIALTRTSPIQDLKKILKEAPALLEKGISIIVFPQHTRGAFDPDGFSTIGCKLAKRAKVPIVPLAIDTRLWGKGKLISDYGPINRDIPVRFAFGKQIVIDKNEKEVHAQYLDFIGKKLQKWDAYTPSVKTSK
jgi:1-acyl-sn-glycerol-3-phosphate acyltransferase